MQRVEKSMMTLGLLAGMALFCTSLDAALFRGGKTASDKKDASSEVAKTAEVWGVWRGPDKNGITDEKDWSPDAVNSPKNKWSVQVNDGYSAVAVTNEYVYTMGNDGENDIVFCLKVETGDIVWRHQYKCGTDKSYPGPRMTPVLDGDNVYTVSREGHVYCLNAKTGKEVWTVNIAKEHGARQPKWQHSGCPIIVDNFLLLNANVSGICLDKLTGKKIWASAGGIGGYATPEHYKYDGKYCAVLFAEKKAFSVDVATGAVIWEFVWETKYDVNAASPIVVINGKDVDVFLSSGYGRGCCLISAKNNRTVEKVWENKAISSHFSSPVLIDGYIYGCDGDSGNRRAKLKCIEMKTGNEVWGEQLGFGSLMVADGKVIYLSETGEMTIAEATHTGFKQIAKGAVLDRKGGVCWNMPILWKGVIYCRNVSGNLVAVEAGKK